MSYVAPLSSWDPFSEMLFKVLPFSYFLVLFFPFFLNLIFFNFQQMINSANRVKNNKQLLQRGFGAAAHLAVHLAKGSSPFLLPLPLPSPSFLLSSFSSLSLSFPPISFLSSPFPFFLPTFSFSFSLISHTFLSFLLFLPVPLLSLPSSLPFPSASPFPSLFLPFPFPNFQPLLSLFPLLAFHSRLSSLFLGWEYSHICLILISYYLTSLPPYLPYPMVTLQYPFPFPSAFPFTSNIPFLSLHYPFPFNIPFPLPPISHPWLLFTKFLIFVCGVGCVGCVFVCGEIKQEGEIPRGEEENAQEGLQGGKIVCLMNGSSNYGVGGQEDEFSITQHQHASKKLNSTENQYKIEENQKYFRKLSETARLHQISIDIFCIQLKNFNLSVLNHLTSSTGGFILLSKDFQDVQLKANLLHRLFDSFARSSHFQLSFSHPSLEIGHLIGPIRPSSLPNHFFLTSVTPLTSFSFFFKSSSSSFPPSLDFLYFQFSFFFINSLNHRFVLPFSFPFPFPFSLPSFHFLSSFICLCSFHFLSSSPSPAASPFSSPFPSLPLPSLL